MLNNANNTLITGGSFTINHARKDAVRSGLKLLQDKISPGAFHDSEERYDPPKCHPRTREAVIKKILGWVDDTNKEAFFMWLYGPAGSGKSAIAQTIAEICSDEDSLAASFFFSRAAIDRSVEIYLVATLVYQLTLSIPEIRDHVGITLENDPHLLSRSLKSQVKALIIKPLSELARSEEGRAALESGPRFVVLDGLDECRSVGSQVYILNVLSAAARQLPVPLFFLVASRAEPHIRDGFSEEPLNSLTVRLVLDNTYHPDADIKLFLESKFADIGRRHPSKAHFPKPWASDADIARLVDKSSGQFIYASTVIKYVESRHHWPPERLEIVFVGCLIQGTIAPLLS